MELAIINKPKTNLSEQYEVEYSRFFISHSPPPSHSSIHPTLTPLQSSRGNWISSSSDSLVSLRLLASGFDRRSFILVVALGHKVLEEHYISKLHFTWPQVSCSSGYPARGSRVVFLSYKDSAGQIQKFALRFLSVYETKQFINSLKEILEDSSDCGEPCSFFGSARSPPSECVISSESPYRPSKDWSPVPSANTQSHRMSPNLNHEPLRELKSLEPPVYYHPVGTTLPNFPPSFTSLLMNCSPAVTQAGAQPSVSDADLKDQIARYLGDSSFQDMLMKVQKVFNEIGDDLTI